MTITFIKLGNYGRLGNSMFQIAATISLALSNNDIYIFPNWKYQNDFSIPQNYFTYAGLIKYSNTYEEIEFSHVAIPYRKSLNLNGYFQTNKYWINHENEIKRLLTPRQDKYNYEFRDDTTSLHVRRTDYLIHEGCYHILDRNNYYDKAIDILNSKKVLIFSDDMKWSKDNFKGNMFEFSEGNDEVTDLHIQSRCSNNIIANSSFSWWSAYLNSYTNKKVIAPKKWFGPKLIPTHNTKDLIPSDWIVID